MVKRIKALTGVQMAVIAMQPQVTASKQATKVLRMGRGVGGDQLRLQLECGREYVGVRGRLGARVGIGGG